MKLTTWMKESRKVSLCPQVRHLFTPDSLSLEILVSLETFTANFQKERELTIDQQEAKGKDLEEVFQSHKEEKWITHFLPRIIKM
jgi:hypothetical protein